MLRPLRRSPAFWLGLFGLSFIVWAWVDSVRVIRQVDWIRPGRHLVLEHRDSAIQFRSVKGQPRPPATPWLYEVRDYPRGVSPHLFPGGKFSVQRVNDFPYTRIQLPYPLVTFCYLAVWAALLFWRRKRVARSK